MVSAVPPATNATVTSSLDLQGFLARFGDDNRYELIDGELAELDPTGPHEEVAAFIGRKLNVEIDRQDLPWFIPLRCLLQPLAAVTALRPDVVVLDRTELEKEPLWQQEPVITLGSSVKFVAEVVSTNWQNDYARKINDYAELEIEEYWIADYAALGGRQFLGYPKQAGLTVCRLVDGFYEMDLLRGEQPIVSTVFPELRLTAEQVLDAWKQG